MSKKLSNVWALSAALGKDLYNGPARLNGAVKLWLRDVCENSDTKLTSRQFVAAATMLQATSTIGQIIAAKIFLSVVSGSFDLKPSYDILAFAGGTILPTPLSILFFNSLVNAQQEDRGEVLAIPDDLKPLPHFNAALARLEK